MMGSFFRGTSTQQNVRFKDKEKALINSREWPPEFEEPVDMSKVRGESVSLTGLNRHDEALDRKAGYRVAGL